MLNNPENARLAEEAAQQAVSDARWYAVHCLSHRESVAAEHLARQSFRAFLPQRRKLRRHARKTDSVVVPFFPGYLFVSIDVSRQRWRCINGTRGVVRLVTQGDVPLPVPAGVVEDLQTACGEDGIIDWRPELAPGEPVRILTGPFAGLVGELDRLDGPARVRVLLEILGGRIPALLSRETVTSASSSL